MPAADYYRKQAQLFAKLAVGTTDRAVVSRYHVMMLEHLAKAEELEPSPDPIGRVATADDGSHDHSSDMDRH